MRPRSAGGKVFSSGRAQGLGEPLHVRHQLRVLAHAHDEIRAHVGGEQDDGVLEVDVAALGVLHPALVEDLEEDLVDVRVGLLHLVEQHHAVGPAADRLGEDAALAVADVAGGRALEGGDRVGLLELAHVDGDEVLLAAVERLGEGQGGLGLADAAGADEHEDADGLVRVVEPGAGGLDAAGDRLEGVALADDPLVRGSRPG